MKMRKPLAAINDIYFILMCVAVVWQSGKAAGNNCTKLLHRLANSQMHFMFCITTNALPVNICEACRIDFRNMRDNYTVVKDECHQYFDENRLNVITRGESVLEDMWSKAYCDDCSQNYTELWQKSNELVECTNSSGQQICFQCYVQYNSLNQLYLQLERDRKGHICFDIEDMMYLKRHQWTKVWNCSHQKSDLSLFITVAVIVINLHVAFYGINYTITKRRERRTHNILNDSDATSDTPRTSRAVIPSSLPVVSTAMDLHPSNPSPSSAAASDQPILNLT